MNPALTLCQPTERLFGTVLSESLTDRLATMNSASRALRCMGYAIAIQDINSGSERPIITIRLVPEQSIAPLLDAASARWFRDTHEGKLGFVHFHNVTVCWRAA